MNETPEKSSLLRRALEARRVVLMATVAGLGLGALYAGSEWKSGFSPVAGPAQAQSLPQQTPQAPVGFADIVARVKPAVVSVRVKIDSDPNMMSDDSPFAPGSPMERFFRRFGRPDGSAPDLPRGPRRHRFTTGQGSGFFISADGYVITNNHVVQRSDSVEVGTDDGKTYTAKVVGADSRSDLALLKVDGRNDFPYVQLAETAPRIGDWVIAVGNPFGLGGTVTAGIVSARGRDIGAGPYDDFIQIDAAVNRGNSGGPTFDVNGRVIGVNTAIFSPSGGSVGIGFAISADSIRAVVNQLKETGTVTRGWIGVQIQPVTADIADSLGLKKAEGALVAEVQPNSPASKAGLQSGDVVTSVNGQPVADARDLSRRVGSMKPGSEINIGIVRKGSQQTIKLSLGKLPDQVEASRGRFERGDRDRGDRDRGDRDRGSRQEEPRLGLSLAPADQVAGVTGGGVVVTGVDPSGPAAEIGFRTGDVILEVGGKPVSNPADVRTALNEARSDGKRTVLMRLKNGDSTRFLAVPLARG